VATNDHETVVRDKYVFDSLYHKNHVGNLDGLVLLDLHDLYGHLQQQMLVFVLLRLHQPEAGRQVFQLLQDVHQLAVAYSVSQVMHLLDLLDSLHNQIINDLVLWIDFVSSPSCFQMA
jgi:hypothetical protein